MVKSLCFKFSASFMALIFLALGLQCLLPIYLLESTKFQLNFFPKMIEDAVVGDALISGQTIKERESKSWQLLATNNLYYRLIDLHVENEVVNVRSTFEPYVYFQVINNHNELVFFSPEGFAESIATIFTSSPNSLLNKAYSSAWSYKKNNHFGISKLLTDSYRHIQGYINLLFMAVREDRVSIFIRFKDSWQSFWSLYHRCAYWA